MTLASLAKFPLSLLLQPIRPSFSSGSNSTKLVATANGLGNASAVDVLAKNSTDDLFSVTTVDVNQLKVNLIERVGKELGVKQEDYDTPAAFGFALKMAVMKLKAEPDGAELIAKIERNLGLDKLGVSLNSVIKAIIDPDGRDAEELDAALRAQAGEADPERAVELDEIGIYRPLR
jgi:hypothetical protein